MGLETIASFISKWKGSGGGLSMCLSNWFRLSPVLVRNFIVSSKSCFVVLSLQCEFIYTVQTKKQWKNSLTS